MKLYYAPGACSLADHIAIHEAGLDADLVKVDLKARTTETGQDYSAINPKGYVPALELDDGELLTENLAILLYLGDRADALIAGDGLPRWRTIEATAFVSTEIHKGYKPFFDPAASEAEKDEARQTLAGRYALIAAQLGERDFLVGDALTIADCYLFVTLTWAQKHGLDIPAPLAAYRDRLKQRPAFARALQEEGLG